MDIAIIGSKESGHGTYPGRVTSEGSDFVFVNGKGVHCVGDSWGEHCNTVMPFDCHSGVTVSGSSMFFINSKAVARVGDKINCGGKITSGDALVKVGD